MKAEIQASSRAVSHEFEGIDKNAAENRLLMRQCRNSELSAQLAKHQATSITLELNILLHRPSNSKVTFCFCLHSFMQDYIRGC